LADGRKSGNQLGTACPRRSPIRFGRRKKVNKQGWVGKEGNRRGQGRSREVGKREVVKSGEGQKKRKGEEQDIGVKEKKMNSEDGEKKHQDSKHRKEVARAKKGARTVRRGHVFFHGERRCVRRSPSFSVIYGRRGLRGC